MRRINSAFLLKAVVSRVLEIICPGPGKICVHDGAAPAQDCCAAIFPGGGTVPVYCRSAVLQHLLATIHVVLLQPNVSQAYVYLRLT